nr:hypothetical protein [Tanacetum cinerariifolium]
MFHPLTHGNMKRIGKGSSGRITPLFPTMVVQSQMSEGSAIPTDPYHTPNILQTSSSQPQKTHKPRKHTRKVTEVPQPSDLIEHVADETVHKEFRDRLVRAATTASSLEVEQDNGNINRTQSKATPNEPSSQGTDSGCGPRIKLNELMELCTNLQSRVLEIEKTKSTQSNEIASLKRRVKKLKKKNRSRTHKLKRLYKVGLITKVESSDNDESLGEDASKQGRIKAINQDEDITLVDDQDDADMFDVNDLGGEEVFVAEQVVRTAATTKELTLAQTLKALKTSKPKVKGIVIQEQEEPGKSTTTATISKQQSQDKGKGILAEEPMKPKKKDQIWLDEEAALKLQANFDEEQRLARERERAQKEQEASIALIEKWDDVQEKINVDHQLVERLQAEEQQKLTDEKRLHCLSKRVEEKRNKPPTQAQKRKITCTYLKNMDGYTLKQLKEFRFDNVQEMFDKAFKRLNTFEEFRIELVQGQEKEKREKEDLIQK